MARHGENIYKRKDGRWEARVLKGYAENGKALYAYFYGRTYKEAKDKIFMSLPYVSPASPTAPQIKEESLKFGAVLDSWLERSKIKLKESSYIKYFNFVNRHIKPALGEYSLLDITNTTLNTFAAEKLKNGKLGASGGLSEKTVRDIMTVIKSVLRFAQEEALMPAISIKLTLPREKKQDMRVLSTDEQKLLENYLCNNIDESKLGILLCMYTGLRVGEVCALKWEDISLTENTLTVKRTMQRIQALDAECHSKTKIAITIPKSDCSLRAIPLPDCLMEKLKAFRPASNSAYFLTGKAERFIEPRTYQNRFKSYINDCGIVDANFHSTRHTFATRCVEVGFEIKSLSEILGHANINITLDRYVHPSFDLKRSNMNKLTLH